MFNMENQQGPAGQHRELCSMSCGSLDGRGVWERRDTCECMPESLCCPRETINIFNQLDSNRKQKKYLFFFFFKALFFWTQNIQK